MADIGIHTREQVRRIAKAGGYTPPASQQAKGAAKTDTATPAEP